MIQLKGNTATYLQYCYARVQGIYRKGGVNAESISDDPSPFVFEHDAERALALKLCQFGEAIDETMVDYKPNLLCQYLFELTDRFYSFYENCKVLDVEEELRDSRLQLCELVARTIQTGLSLLGINTVDRM